MSDLEKLGKASIIPEEERQEITDKFFEFNGLIAEEAAKTNPRTADAEANIFIGLVRKYSKMFDVWIKERYPYYTDGVFTKLWKNKFGDLLGDKAKWLL